MFSDKKCYGNLLLVYIKKIVNEVIWEKAVSEKKIESTS